MANTAPRVELRALLQINAPGGAGGASIANLAVAISVGWLMTLLVPLVMSLNVMLNFVVYTRCS
jgi:hypothetical protein